MTEKELFEKRLAEMEEDLSKHKAELKTQQEEFIKFTNEKIEMSEFYYEATGMLSKMSRSFSLVEAKQSEVNSMKNYIEKLG